MKYKIVFDTQAVWTKHESGLDHIFHSSLADVKDFLIKNKVMNVTLCIPAMVVEERLQQKLEIIKKTIEKVNNDGVRLKNIGFDFHAVDKKNDTETVLRGLADRFVSEHEIEVMPMPDLNLKVLTDRAIKKLKPFDDRTAGFKDTIIFFSIIEDARKNADQTYILVTENKSDFTEAVRAEFSELTGCNLHIAFEIEDLKVLLDDIIPLRLKLKSLHEEIKEEVGKKSGTLTIELNRSQSMIRASPTTYLSGSFLYDQLADGRIFKRTEDDPGIYDFKGLSVDNITGIGDKIFSVSGLLNVSHAKNREEPQAINLDSFMTVDGLIQTFDFMLIYNSETKDISEISFNKSWRLITGL